MKRKASAEWKGSLKDGNGSVSTESGVLAQAQYSFGTRFESGIGTNPEELVAAAHAGCFSMALSAQLGTAGLVPEKIATTAVVTFDKLDQGWTVTESHLEVSATVPGATPEIFAKLAQDAKTGCPLSRLLNTTITMDAKLTT
jgi:osmotically inducible protein OsmC